MSTEDDLRGVRDAALKAVSWVVMLAGLGLAGIAAGLWELWKYQH